jgi:hypothetical protein
MMLLQTTQTVPHSLYCARSSYNNTLRLTKKKTISKHGGYAKSQTRSPSSRLHSAAMVHKNDRTCLRFLRKKYSRVGKGQVVKNTCVVLGSGQSGVEVVRGGQHPSAAVSSRTAVVRIDRQPRRTSTGRGERAPGCPRSRSQTCYNAW